MSDEAAELDDLTFEQQAKALEESQEDENEESIENEEQPETEVEAKKEEPKVNLGALHQERQYRKQAQEQLSQLQNRYDSELGTLKEQLKEFRAKANPAPDYDDDPISNLKHRLDETEKQLQETEQEKSIREKQEKQLFQFRQHIETTRQALHDAETDYRQEHDDYDDAAVYLRDRALQELQLMGMTEQQAAQSFAQQLLGTTQFAVQSGRSPADLIYNLAKSRGYTGPSKLDNVKKGQENATSLSKAGSGPKTTLTDISKMSDDEFDEYWSKLERDNHNGR